MSQLAKHDTAAETCLQMRPDLVWTPHQFAGGPSYSVTNPATGMHYEIGFAEYAFASMLDGNTDLQTASEATQALAKRTGRPEIALDQSEAEAVAAWLEKTGLATQADVSRDVRRIGKHAGTKGRVRISPLCVKTSLKTPTRLIDTLTRYTAPWTNRYALVATLTLIVYAITQVIGDLSGWNAAFAPIVHNGLWWQIGLAAIVLRVIHEAAHAVVARRMGVDIDEFGILWILLLPLPFVDVSRSWQLNRRRDRIAIAAAGMLAELAVAAMAVVVFGLSHSPEIRHIAATIAVTASAVTLIFNANVLMRFDGYHILVDLVRLPNLYSDASSYWSRLASRIVLGTSSEGCHPPRGLRGVFFRIYGVAILAWRVVVLVGLLLAAEYLFQGAGSLLAVAAIVTLMTKAIVGLPKTIRTLRPIRATLGLLTTAAILFVIASIPMPGSGVETGVIQFHEPETVRCASDGFVREVFVSTGEHVEAGQRLAMIENRELEQDYNDLVVQLAKANLNFRRLVAQSATASIDAQRSQINSLKQQIQIRRNQLDKMDIVATSDGVIASEHDLSDWLDQYVREGTTLMRIVRPDEIEVVFTVDQTDRNQWQDRIGDSVRLTTLDRTSLQHTGEVTEVAPTPTDRLPADSLSAQYGGPLAVRTVDPTGAGKQSDTMRLLRPRYEVRLAPKTTLSAHLHDQQSVRVSADDNQKTVGQTLLDSGTAWVQDRLAGHSLLRQFSNF